MSDDRIAEIRARHEDNASIGSIIHGPDHPPRWTLVGWKAHHDRAFLLLELDRVSADNERLRAMLPPTAHSGVRSGPGEGSWSVFAGKVVEERDAARAEVERLRAEIERLKQEPELLRAELISLANAARKALADAYDRAKESKP